LRLSASEFQAFSQNGEDGIIAEIFRRIGVTTRTFCEIGVGDGLENNTALLLRQGWQGTWVEGNPTSVSAIQYKYASQIKNKVLAVHDAFVNAENINHILKDTPSDCDLLSIDIDCNTYWIWKALKALNPRIVVIEYNATYPPNAEWVFPYNADAQWDGTTNFGASLKAFEVLGHEKGYNLVGCDLIGINAFFVRNDLCSTHFCEPFTAENHFEPARYHLWRRFGNNHPSG
jgi:hypothetical protein